MWCAYGSLRASSFSSVEQMGHTEVVVELALAVLLACLEWHEGVLRADRPAESAIRRSGREGSEYSWWCVSVKRAANPSHRDCEYQLCKYQLVLLIWRNLRLLYRILMVLIWRICKQTRCNQYLRTLALHVLGEVFPAVLSCLYQPSLSAKLDILLQPQFKF